MKREDQEIEAELQQLRQQRAGTAVTTEHRTRLQRRVEELMSRSHAPRIASLGATILHEIDAFATPAPRRRASSM